MAPKHDPTGPRRTHARTSRGVRFRHTLDEADDALNASGVMVNRMRTSGEPRDRARDSELDALAERIADARLQIGYLRARNRDMRQNGYIPPDGSGGT